MEDTNSDNLATHQEFVAFFDELAANYSSVKATAAPTFDETPIAFQLPFVFYFCDHLTSIERYGNYGCRESLLRNANEMNRENFGFLLTENGTENRIESLCGDVYIPSIEAEFIFPCSDDVTPTAAIPTAPSVVSSKTRVQFRRGF